MFITTTLTGIAVIAVTGTAIGTAAGIIVRPPLEKMAATIKARLTRFGKNVITSAQTPNRSETRHDSHRQ
jgi:hypothetical protein